MEGYGPQIAAAVTDMVLLCITILNVAARGWVFEREDMMDVGIVMNFVWTFLACLVSGLFAAAIGATDPGFGGRK